MEVMLEIYRTLKTLGMEWREKKNLGGLGGAAGRRGGSGGIERARDLDGGGQVDLKTASGIYFVETRARVQDVVVRPSRSLITVASSDHYDQVLMNLQLYMVDSINYLVDFHHKKSYKASTEPGAGKFDMAVADPPLPDSASRGSGFSETSSESERSLKDKEREEEVVSPFVFMDVACRLILELAGGSE